MNKIRIGAAFCFATAFSFPAAFAFAAAGFGFAAAIPAHGSPEKGKFGIKLRRMPAPKVRTWTVHEGETNVVFDAALCRRLIAETGAAWCSEKKCKGGVFAIAPLADPECGEDAWRERAMWPIPAMTRMQFADEMKRRTAAGESVSVEVGVDADGRIDPTVAAYLKSVAWINQGKPEPQARSLNPSMTHIQRTMKALEESTAGNPARIKVFFYGQSIVAEEWTDQLVEDLRARYPTARLQCVKKAIGGFEADRLRDTAHSDLYPAGPDLVFFHVYGAMDCYEEIVKNLRERTTAEIVLWTSHVDASQPIDRKWTDSQDRFEKIRAVAEKYGCALVELREKWIDMLECAGWMQRKPLADNIHHNPWGVRMYGRMIGEELYRIPGESGHPEITGSRRDFPASELKAERGVLTLEFTGSRVDAISGGTGRGTAEVWIDGRPAKEIREIWATTRPSNGPRWMPAVRRVFLGEGIVPRREIWTMTFPDGISTNGWAHGWGTRFDEWPDVRYSLSGSVTGFDGEGSVKSDFTSRSGRIAIPCGQMDVMLQCAGFMQPLPENFTVTWDVYPQCADPYDCAADAGAATTLVQGLSNGRHTLELKPSDGAVPGVRAFRVHAPPRRPKPVLL